MFLFFLSFNLIYIYIYYNKKRNLAEIDGRSTNSIICKILERYVNEEQNMQAIIKYLKEKGE